MDLQKEREAFEKLPDINAILYNSEFGFNEDINQYYHPNHTEHRLNYAFLMGAWSAWQAAKAQAVPDGFVLVPKEPTQELLNKMQDFFVGAFENGLTGGQSIHCAYIAMIEAQEQK